MLILKFDFYVNVWRGAGIFRHIAQNFTTYTPTFVQNDGEHTFPPYLSKIEKMKEKGRFQEIIRDN